MSLEAGLVETYRGGVAAWECDVFGHLNIAFYPERFADAAGDLLERRAPGRRWRTVALDTRYEREFRAGEGIVIRSGLLEVHLDRVRLAHEAVESASGARTTVAEHVLAPVADGVTELPSAPEFAWQRLPLFHWPQGLGRIPAGRDRVQPAETEAGSLTLSSCVHRFSNGCLHVIDAIGMTHDYRRRANHGFATFETRRQEKPRVSFRRCAALPPCRGIRRATATNGARRGRNARPPDRIARSAGRRAPPSAGAAWRATSGRC